MKRATTPAGKRLRRAVLACYSGGSTLLGPVDWDECARAVLDSVERDRLPHEHDEEHLLALAMEGEWQHFMNASPEAWVQKAQSIRARIEHIRNKENIINMADDDVPVAPLTEDDHQALTKWVEEWTEEFIQLSELPDTWNLSERGSVLKMTRTPAEEGEQGAPSRPIVVEGRYVGMTTHEVGLDEGTGTCQRVDIILMSGSSFPLRRDSLIEVDGKVVWAPEE